MLSPTQPVANIVLDHSECAQVFQQHRIDFCCRGELSLEQAAKERGVELTALLGQLERAIEERRGDAPGPMRNGGTRRAVAATRASGSTPVSGPGGCARSATPRRTFTLPCR